MTTITAPLALLAFTVLIAWTTGGLLLRTLGTLTVFTGLALTASGEAAGLALAIVGAIGWLAGHYLYAVRLHTYRSPLARRIYLSRHLQRIDVTRDWATPTTRAAARRRSCEPRRR
ncbi:hypothetical protein DSM112329_00798 [Paraconexibacter sp. AEG42_29]|uniref:Uncharacterized protein n=1 Tax=Paraconexibacter sp. AEG42_29 TaxID=2997339 RepID=A0AAU7AQP8_9ACTN